MACELCGHSEEDHYQNEDGTSQGSVYECKAKNDRRTGGICGCPEYEEESLEEEDE